MKHVNLFLFACMISFTFGQTNYTVEARASSWNPNNLTIDVGDSVTWINDNQGMHNVNGTQQTFQYNPESFGFMPTGTNWTYGHRFNTPGTYSFRCDTYPTTMTGVIVVQETAGITEDQMGNFFVYPNPAENVINIKTNWSLYTISIYDMLGDEVLSKTMYYETILDVSALNIGTYYIKISSDKGEYQQRLIKT